MAQYTTHLVGVKLVGHEAARRSDDLGLIRQGRTLSDALATAENRRAVRGVRGGNGWVEVVKKGEHLQAHKQRNQLADATEAAAKSRAHGAVCSVCGEQAMWIQPK